MVQTHGHRTAMPKLGPAGPDAGLRPALHRRGCGRWWPGIRLADETVAYVVDLVRATRDHPALQFGASPRAANMLAAASRAAAVLDGRDFVIPDDVKGLFKPLLRHRVVLAPSAEIEGLSTDQVLEQILAQVGRRAAARDRCGRPGRAHRCSPPGCRWRCCRRWCDAAALAVWPVYLRRSAAGPGVRRAAGAAPRGAVGLRRPRCRARSTSARRRTARAHRAGAGRAGGVPVAVAVDLSDRLVPQPPILRGRTRGAGRRLALSARAHAARARSSVERALGALRRGRWGSSPTVAPRRAQAAGRRWCPTSAPVQPRRPALPDRPRVPRRPEDRALPGRRHGVRLAARVRAGGRPPRDRLEGVGAPPEAAWRASSGPSATTRSCSRSTPAT